MMMIFVVFAVSREFETIVIINDNLYYYNYELVLVKSTMLTLLIIL